MFEPTAEEIAQAKRLGIEQPERFTGPQLRAKMVDIKVGRDKTANLRMKYNRFFNLCLELGLELERAADPRPGDLRRVMELYADALPEALKSRGIVPGATLTMPACRDVAAGRYQVGRTHTRGADTLMLVLRGVKKPKGYEYSALIIWRHATKIKPPQS